MVESLGENIALYDSKVKDMITHVTNSKTTSINEYKKLQHILPKYDESKRKILEKILNDKKQQFEYTLRLKNKQNEAFSILLNYLNSLEKKDKNLDIKQILNQMKKLDSEITLLNDLIK